MKKLKHAKGISIYLEVQDVAEDEYGDPCPAGVEINFARSATIDSYEKAVAVFEVLIAMSEDDVKSLLTMKNEGLLDAKRTRIITQEEYATEYDE